MIAKAEVQDVAATLGVDLVGFGEGLLVLGNHIPIGVTGLRDLAAKQAACEAIVRSLATASRELAGWLTRRGIPAAPLPTRAPEAQANTPAGQSSRRLRAAAVAAGLGTWGLNMAVLSPRFGPRLMFGGVEADHRLEPDPPLQGDLCLGLEECGRCAAVCPETAIPLRAPEGMALPIVRNVEPACLRSSHRDGSFSACIECLQVCPVGEDYEEVERSPERQRDLPGGVRRIRAGGFVMVEHIGPRVRRLD